MAYVGVKIPKDIIIVSKTNLNGVPQGYVVDKGNNNMLKNALEWGKTVKYFHDESGNYLRDDKGMIICETLEATQHEYPNGNFEVEIIDSANSSSQGGKLSFWTCRITAPDNEQFDIGINSDLLLDIIRKKTFINGKCSDKVWLGRVKGAQVGIFTEDMELFSQSIEDEAIRTRKKSSKYKPGDIISDITTGEQVYLGEGYEYFHLINGWDSSEICLYKKPKKKYFYCAFHENFNPNNIYFYTLDSKAPKVLENKSTTILPLDEIIKNRGDIFLENAKSHEDFFRYFLGYFYGIRYSSELKSFDNIFEQVCKQIDAYNEQLDLEHKNNRMQLYKKLSSARNITILN